MASAQRKPQRKPQKKLQKKLQTKPTAKPASTKPAEARRTAKRSTRAGLAPDEALVLEAVALPATLPERLRQQIGPLLDQAMADGPDGLSLLTHFRVQRAGEHVYDLTLFVDDDGAVYRKGTLERVASFSQGGATGSGDSALLSALNAARAAWLKKPVRPAAPRIEPAVEAKAATIPTYGTIHPPDQYELKRLSPKAKRGLLRITKAPTSAELEALATWLPPRAADFVVELGPGVPLTILDRLHGVPFVVLAAGRKDWAGLGALPRSVRRLSVRKSPAPTLDELPKDHPLTELELDAPKVSGGPLRHLTKLAWTGAEDAAWVSKHPALRELALRNAKINALPASASIERLLLLAPRGLASLKGVEDLPRLSYLRLDSPAGMKRLGDLSRSTARTIHLNAAHRIADLGDLSKAPALQVLGVLQTQLGAAGFLGLKGKLKGGAFQLKNNTETRALQAHLGLPFVKTHHVERFFDEG